MIKRLQRIRRQMAAKILQVAKLLAGYRPEFEVDKVPDRRPPGSPPFPKIHLPPWGRVVVKHQIRMGMLGYFIAVVRPADGGPITAWTWVPVHPGLWDDESLAEFARALNVPIDDLRKAVNAL